MITRRYSVCAVVVSLALMTIGVVNGQSCPGSNNQRVAGTCTQYYKCSPTTNVLSVFTCPTGFAYDLNGFICRTSGQVTTCTTGTGTGTGTGTAGSITPVNVGQACFVNTGLDSTLVTGSCTQYYKCVNSVLQSYTCPTGFYFSLITRVCAPQATVACVDQSTSGGENRLTTNAVLSIPAQQITQAPDTVPSCPSSEGLIVANTNCQSFYSCVGGVLTTITCSTGQEYNRASRLCGAPTGLCPANTGTNANGPVTGPATGAARATPSSTVPTCPFVDFDVIPGTGCAQYYVCQSGGNLTPFKVPCPTGQLFSTQNLKCETGVTCSTP